MTTTRAQMHEGNCRRCGERMRFDVDDENWLHIDSGSQFCCADGHTYATGGDGELIAGCCVRCGYISILVDLGGDK